MPASKQDKVLVACPHCGHQQAEPRTAISTICKKCRGHFHVQEVLHPARKTVAAAPEKRHVTCFDCGAELDVPVSAESTMCKRCSRYVDLKDYKITSAVSKNFKTKGAFVVEAKGYVFNTEAIVGEAVIKGRFLGKLIADSLTIYSTAEIKGSFKTAKLIIPAGNHFRWHELLKLTSAEIAGELANNLTVENTLVLKSTARMFGDVEAQNLVVEEGAVVVGHLRVGLQKQ
ncbi:MAG: polymer-forming cytoskeletal protein [Verrucomicrobia bacterium]|nr:MAG: polymer-forming cytoskeletal protein [Verrucomicrobiota bacterium]